MIGLLNGGHMCIQHMVLRLILWWKNFAPINYVRFLEFAVEYRFLQKDHGGYKFAPSLMEHFSSVERVQ